MSEISLIVCELYSYKLPARPCSTADATSGPIRANPPMMAQIMAKISRAAIAVNQSGISTDSK